MTLTQQVNDRESQIFVRMCEAFGRVTQKQLLDTLVAAKVAGETTLEVDIDDPRTLLTRIIDSVNDGEGSSRLGWYIPQMSEEYLKSALAISNPFNSLVQKITAAGFVTGPVSHNPIDRSLSVPITPAGPAPAPGGAAL